MIWSLSTSVLRPFCGDLRCPALLRLSDRPDLILQCRRATYDASVNAIVGCVTLCHYSPSPCRDQVKHRTRSIYTHDFSAIALHTDTAPASVDCALVTKKSNVVKVQLLNLGLQDKQSEIRVILRFKSQNFRIMVCSCTTKDYETWWKYYYLLPLKELQSCEISKPESQTVSVRLCCIWPDSWRTEEPYKVQVWCIASK